MPTATPKSLIVSLTTTLTTTIFTATTTTKLDHVIVGNKTTAGKIQLTQTKGSNTGFLIPNSDIGIGEPIELAAITMESGDIIRGGMTTCTDATIVISYTEYT